MSFKGYKREIKLGFDYDEVKKGIPSVNKQMAVLNAEFRKSYEEAKISGLEIEKLGTRHDFLSERLRLQNEKVAEYTKKLEIAQNAEGNNARAIENHTTSLALAQSQSDMTKMAIVELAKEMEIQQLTVDKSSKEWLELENSLKLIDLEFEKASISAEKSGKEIGKLNVEHKYLIDRLKEEERILNIYKDKLLESTNVEIKNEEAIRENTIALSKAEIQVEKTKIQIENISKKLKEQEAALEVTTLKWNEYGDKAKKLGKRMTIGLTTPILAAGAASFKMAADYEDAFGKAEVVFERNIGTIKEWSDTSLKNFRLSRKVAIDMATDFSAGFKQMGITLNDSTKMGQKLTELTMDMVHYYNTTVDETNRAMSAILSGQTEPLKRFNIFMTQANLQQFAYTKGIKKQVSEMTEAEKAQLRYNYVLEKTAEAHGHAKKEQGSATSEMEYFKQLLIEVGDKFGQVIIPLLTPFLEKINSLLEFITELNDSTKKFLVTMAGILIVAGPILMFIGKIFKGIGELSEGMEKVSTSIKVAGGAGKAMKGLLTSTQFLGFVKWAAIITVVVSAITVLIGAINHLLGKGQEMNQMFNSIDNITGNIAGATKNTRVRGYAVGTNYLKQDELLQAHKGEAIVPADNNPWNPNATNPWGSGGNGDTFNINVQMSEVDEVYKLVTVFKDLKQVKKGGFVYE